MQVLNACPAQVLTDFDTNCFATSATNAGCNSWLGTNFTSTMNVACGNCLFAGGSPDGGAGGGGTGALALDPSGGGFVGVNWGGCAALADTTSGPACAAAYAPASECDFYVCESSTTSTCTSATVQACLTTADGTGGVCNSKAAAVQSACATDFADGGVLSPSGKCGTVAQVLNAVCGTGP